MLYALLGTAVLSTATSCDNEEDRVVRFNSSVVKAAEDFLDTRDSTIYKTVQIGDQIWFAENLRYAPPSYTLEGAFTWGERLVEDSKIKPSTADIIAVMLAIAHDPQYDEWKIKMGNFDMSLVPTIEGTLKQVERGRMTIEEARASIAQYLPAFEIVLQERLLVYAQSPELRAVAGRASFEAAEKKNEGYVAQYGFLYTYKGALAAVPEGWRLPSDEDWKKLEQTLGLSAAEANLNEAWRGEGLATLLNLGGASGFNAVKGGANVYVRENTYLYMNKDKAWYYWTSTQYTQNDSIDVAMIRMSSDFNTKVWRGTSRLTNVYRPVLYSVRCVKDAN